MILLHPEKLEDGRWISRFSLCMDRAARSNSPARAFSTEEAANRAAVRVASAEIDAREESVPTQPQTPSGPPRQRERV